MSIIHRFDYFYVVKKGICKYIGILFLILLSKVTLCQTHIQQTDSIELEKVLSLSRDFQDKGDFEKALYYFQLHDSLQLAYHRKEVSKFNNNIAFKESKIIRKLKTYRNVFITSSLIILVLLAIIFYNFRTKLKANKKLSLQNESIKRKNLEIKNQTLRLSKINHELEKLSIVASKTDNAIIIARTDGTVEWINDGYTRMYGYTLEEFLKQKGETLIDSSSSSEIDSIFQKTINEKKSQIYESEVKSKDGRIYHTQTTLTPILNSSNEIIKFIAIDSDISKLKQIEKELHKTLVTKDKFFSIIAHDLKNPFNTLMGLAQLLHHGYDRMDPEKVKHFHRNLYEISKNGYGLLVNLLEWARSQMGKIKFNPEHQNLYALTEETFSLYNTKSVQKEIALNNNLSEDSYAVADKNMLKTIFRNIISNALKFTDRGGAIEISEEIVDAYTQITIKDTGVGIAPDDIKKLFKLDESHSTEGTEEEIGTGLGLILCKEFVENHGGKIWVESKVGKGSSFIFTLPLEK